MTQLPYYNTFFQTTHLPVIQLSQKLAQIAPDNLNHVFYAILDEANDTNIRLVRHYWAMKGQPDKNIIIALHNAYPARQWQWSLGCHMHAQGGLPIANIHHIMQPDWWSEGQDMSPADFALHAAEALDKAIQSLGENQEPPSLPNPFKGLAGYYSHGCVCIKAICSRYEILLIVTK